MSGIEVWAAGRPFSGISQETLLSNVRVLFPKATPEQLSRFMSGARFMVTRAPDEETAKRMVAALTKAGVPSEYLVPAPKQPTRPLPDAAQMKVLPAGAESLSASDRANAAGAPTLSDATTRGAKHRRTPRREAGTPPARRLPWTTRTIVIFSIIVAGLFTISLMGYQRWAAHRQMVATFTQQRLQIIAQMKADLDDDRPAAALAAAERWKRVGDGDVAALGATALTNLQAAIAQGDATVLRGFGESDFPQYAALFAELLRVANQRRDIANQTAAHNVTADCARSGECLYDKAGADGEIACSDFLASFAANSALHAYRWTSTFSRYSQYRYRREGVITYLGNEMEFQNGIGAWVRQRYECDYDAVNRKVVDARFG